MCLRYRPSAALGMLRRRLTAICIAAAVVMMCTTACARAQQKLWRANEESGSYGAWNLGEYGGHFDSGAASSEIDETHAHSGSYALKMTSDTTHGVAGTRNFRWSVDSLGTPLPKTAIYIAWYYWDKVYDPTLFWSIMQWKTRTNNAGGNRTDWTLDVANDGKGMYLEWFDLHQRTNHRGCTTSNSIRPGKWYKVEVIFDFDEIHGSVKSYLNDEPWFSISDVPTQWPTTSSNPRYRQWSINNYT